VRWNAFCRSRPQPIAFMYCLTGGASGSVFVDHGPGFLVRDKDGKNPLIKLVDRVQEAVDADGVPYTQFRYITPDGQPLESLEENGLVQFSEVTGCTSDAWKTEANPAGSLNELGPVRIKSSSKDPKFTFRLMHEETDAETGEITSTAIAGLSAWEGGGVITEKKEGKVMPFQSLEQQIATPGGLDAGFVMTDMTFSQSELQLHIAYQAAFQFEEENGRYPNRGDAADLAKCVEMAKAFEAQHSIVGGMGMEVNVEIVERVAAHFDVELQPMCAFFGGLVAQELVKISGKFTPIHQFLNFHCFEALPDPAPQDTAPLGGRYDDFIAVYGKAFQEQLGNLRIFMVGCGALGCEYVKNFALGGVCCGPEGLLTITDNDTIEVSNLNRQFLFRSENVGQDKAIAATERSTAMNAAIKIRAMTDLVAPHTEHIFNDGFWSELDLVCNALDNMKARFYVDDRCVFFEKPLLESGTTGTSANVDVVVPHVTQSYSDGGNADEGGGVPMCTLRNFPHLIDHCIEWARAKFEDLFVSPAQAAEKFSKDPADFVKKMKASTIQLADKGPRATALGNALNDLPLLKTTLATAENATMVDCVRLAFEVFHKLFRDTILDLTTVYPEDYKNASGDVFWTGHKKFPAVADYDPSNQTHVDFMIAASNMFACMLKVHPAKHASVNNDHEKRWMADYREDAWLSKTLKKVAVPKYEKGKVSMEGDDATGGGADGDGDDDSEDIAKVEALLAELTASAAAAAAKGGGDGTVASTTDAADFEKDDDDNFHIDFITACANLRAANYHIPEAPRHKCKMIAGNIIPAIATTTASVTGLVMMEMFKVLQKKPVDKMRNGNYNLGTNSYMMFEANQPKQIKDEVKITLPDPKQFPDAYDEKGTLKPEYKDPSLMLGFAEEEKKFPNPHTKYDKFWVEDTKDMTVQQLREAVDAQFKEAGLHCTMICAPPLRVEMPKTEDNATGVGAKALVFWSEMLRGTNENLEKKWVELLLTKSTRDDENPIMDDPIDVSKHLLYNGLTFAFENEDDEEVDVAPIVVKLGAFEFVPYLDRPAKAAAPWL